MSQKIDPIKIIKKRKNLLIKLIKKKTFWVIILILGLIITFYQSFFVYIEPDEIGIKQVNISLIGKSGLQNKTYASGWHFKIPLVEEYILFPQKLLKYELADIRGRSNKNEFFYSRALSIKQTQLAKKVYRSSMRQGAANIQTNDGFYVKVDVTIFYKVVDPIKVATTLGRTPKEFMQNGIAKKAESVLKDAFGRLTTEEFYNSTLREEKAIIAKRIFNEKLKREGLEVQYVLVRYFEYSQEIQKNIEEKKLKDQLVFKEQAEAKAKIEEALLKKVREEGASRVKVELEKGKAYVVRKQAEKNNYVRKKRASGDLLVKLAEAEKIKLINNAYRHKGAERVVGLEMAKVLKNIDLMVIPSDGKNGFNPMNLDKTLKLFNGVSK